MVIDRIDKLSTCKFLIEQSILGDLVTLLGECIFILALLKLLRPFKIDCLFCARARIGFTSILPQTHAQKLGLFLNAKLFFGLKKYEVEAEKTAFKVFTCHSGAMWSFFQGP